jgi:hypothetical protein
MKAHFLRQRPVTQDKDGVANQVPVSRSSFFGGKKFSPQTTDKNPQGPIFHTFFPQKITFRGKFRGISWKNDLTKLLRGKFHFSNIFGVKIFRGIFPENFPGKNVRKIGPRIIVDKKSLIK